MLPTQRSAVLDGYVIVVVSGPRTQPHLPQDPATSAAGPSHICRRTEPHLPQDLNHICPGPSHICPRTQTHLRDRRINKRSASFAAASARRLRLHQVRMCQRAPARPIIADQLSAAPMSSRTSHTVRLHDNSIGARRRTNRSATQRCWQWERRRNGLRTAALDSVGVQRWCSGR
jgi:hypothetical protein